MLIKARNLLAYLAVKYSQNWEDMFNAIKTKEDVSYETIEATINTLKGEYITIIDDSYPEELKHIFRPPFVIFLNQEDQNKFNDISSRIYCSEYNLGDELIESPYEAGLEEATKLDLQDEFEETFTTLLNIGFNESIAAAQAFRLIKDKDYEKSLGDMS